MIYATGVIIVKHLYAKESKFLSLFFHLLVQFVKIARACAKKRLDNHVIAKINEENMKLARLIKPFGMCY